MKNFSIFLLFLILGISFLNAQENQKLDSLAKAYHSQTDNLTRVETARAIFIETRRYNPEMALEYLKNGLQISKNIGSELNEGIFYRDLGLYYKNYYNRDSAIFYFDKSDRALDGKLVIKNNGLLSRVDQVRK